MDSFKIFVVVLTIVMGKYKTIEKVTLGECACNVSFPFPFPSFPVPSLSLP